MAKIVIAGSANCPRYAKIELLADQLVKNLPDFKLHKIVKQPTDWQSWLNNICKDRGWIHTKSPIVWRELVDRGGKGMLIGGPNDFQEYVSGYYGVQSTFTSDDMCKIADENLKTKEEVDEEVRQLLAKVKPLHVGITNASNPVCYHLINAICDGKALHPDTEISLRFYDSKEENLESLRGMELETLDLASIMLRQTAVMSDLHQAFTDCSVIILLDELLQGEGESREDWLKRNHELYSHYGKVINEVARKDVKVIVAGGGPVNLNAYVIIQNAPSIPQQNIVAVSRTLENRVKSLLAEKLSVNSASVVDVVVWGNIGGAHHIDISKSRVHNYDGAIWGPPSFSQPVLEMLHDKKWLQTEFPELVEKRKETVESALGRKAAMTDGTAIVSLIGHWWNGSSSGQVFSLGVCSEGWYEVPEGLVFSYPVTFDPKGYWTIHKDMELDEDTRQKIKDSIQDLVAEKEVIYPPPKPPSPEPEPEAEQAGGEDQQGAAPAGKETEQTGEEGQQVAPPEGEETEQKPAVEGENQQDAGEDTEVLPSEKETKEEAEETTKTETEVTEMETTEQPQPSETTE